MDASPRHENARCDEAREGWPYGIDPFTSTRRQTCRELRPADAEFAVDTGEVGLDGADAHEELRRQSPCSSRPRAASSATRRSVSVSSSEAGARPLIRRSSARALSAHSRAPSSSKIAKRLLKRLTRSALLLRPPLHDAQTEQRAAALQRERRRVRQRALECRQRIGQVVLGREDQSAAASGAGSRKRASRGARHSFRRRRDRNAPRSSSPRAMRASIASGQTECAGSVSRPQAAVLAGHAGDRRRSAVAGCSSSRPRTPSVKMAKISLRHGRKRNDFLDRARASSTRPRSASRSARRGPPRDARGREPLLAEFLGRAGVFERLLQLPASHSISLSDQRIRCGSPRRLVTPLPLQLLGHDARTLDLAEAHQPAPSTWARAVLPVEGNPRRYLHLHAPLERAPRCALTAHVSACPPVAIAMRARIANELRLLRSHRASMSAPTVRLPPAKGSTLERPGSVTERASSWAASARASSESSSVVGRSAVNV